MFELICKGWYLSNATFSRGIHVLSHALRGPSQFSDRDPAFIDCRVALAPPLCIRSPFASAFERWNVDLSIAPVINCRTLTEDRKSRLICTEPAQPVSSSPRVVSGVCALPPLRACRAVYASPTDHRIQRRPGESSVMFSKFAADLSKSFTSNITSNYTLSTEPVSFSGPWKIYDAKKKSTKKPASVFVFEKKSLEPPGGSSLSGRSDRGGGLKRAHEEVIERLKKEASSLARLRHPSVLELVEPVEDTRGGGLMFATEPVTTSLAGLLQEKDEQEKAGGVGGRSSRYVVEEANGHKRRRELEIDELEIQKGLLQVAKGLEFLHESAGLVHANLTPDAIFINAKVGNDIHIVPSVLLIAVTVGLENIGARVLHTTRELYQANLRVAHLPFRSPQS